jgi:hypothetical protein
MAGLTAVNPHTGVVDHLMAAMADPVEESMLHMVIPEDSARTPSFTFFGDPDYFFQSSGPATPVIGNGFAWNHGDIQPEIARTFIGIVGPGVRQLGATTAFFSDHVDVRPTLMFLVGLTDDYTHDGRVLSEAINKNILPKGIHDNQNLAEALGQAYKSINAPFGALAMASLKVSTATAALTSNSTGDTEYLSLENEIQSWTEQRDSFAGQMKSILEAAEYQGAKIDTKQAQNLITACRRTRRTSGSRGKRSLEIRFAGRRLQRGRRPSFSLKFLARLRRPCFFFLRKFGWFPRAARSVIL